MSPVYAHEILSQYDIYFWKSSHFIKILNVALLSVLLNLEALYLAELCIYLQSKNYASANNILKIMNF